MLGKRVVSWGYPVRSPVASFSFIPLAAHRLADVCVHGPFVASPVRHSAVRRAGSAPGGSGFEPPPSGGTCRRRRAGTAPYYCGRIVRVLDRAEMHICGPHHGLWLQRCPVFGAACGHRVRRRCRVQAVPRSRVGLVCPAWQHQLQHQHQTPPQTPQTRGARAHQEFAARTWHTLGHPSERWRKRPPCWRPSDGGQCRDRAQCRRRGHCQWPNQHRHQRMGQNVRRPGLSQPGLSQRGTPLLRPAREHDHGRPSPPALSRWLPSNCHRPAKVRCPDRRRPEPTPLFAGSTTVPLLPAAGPVPHACSFSHSYTYTPTHLLVLLLPLLSLLCFHHSWFYTNWFSHFHSSSTTRAAVRRFVLLLPLLLQPPRPLLLLLPHPLLLPSPPPL